MKKNKILAVLLVIFCTLASHVVLAHGGGGGHGGGGHGGGHGGGFGGGGHHGGFIGGYGGGYGGGYYGYGSGYGYGYGLGYPYNYGNPYYYYPQANVTAVPSYSQTYIQQAPVQQTVPVQVQSQAQSTVSPPPPASLAQTNQPGYWYYCKKSKSYYPYVKTCPAGWEQVSPTPSPQ